MNNLLKQTFDAKVKELTALYIDEREVPAVDSVDIYPVLLVNGNHPPFRYYTNGKAGMFTEVYVPDVEGTFVIEDRPGINFRKVVVHVSNDTVRIIEHHAQATIQRVNLALMRELRKGASELLNLYVKRYTFGHVYSFIENADQTYKCKKGENHNIGYTLWQGQPINISDDMYEVLISDTQQATSAMNLSFGRKLNTSL